MENEWREIVACLVESQAKLHESLIGFTAAQRRQFPHYRRIPIADADATVIPYLQATVSVAEHVLSIDVALHFIAECEPGEPDAFMRPSWVRGCYVKSTGEIEIRNGMDPMQSVRTALHECRHQWQAEYTDWKGYEHLESDADTFATNMFHALRYGGWFMTQDHGAQYVRGVF